MKLSALRLHVHRLERAADFYGTRLGLPLRVDGRRQGWCVFDLGGGVDLVVEAVAPDADEDEQALVGRPTGVSFAVDDIQAAQQALAARGVPFASAPERQAWGGWTTSFEDPDGNALQLVQHPLGLTRGDPTMDTPDPAGLVLDVRHATLADQLPIRRMLELYQHDLSDIWDQDLDVHGEYGYALERYWHEPVHQAFVFRCNGHPAGFALVDDDVCLRDNQLWMAQFFVLKKYRRRRVGQRAAMQVFDAIRGRWEVGQMAGNHRAHAFWRHVIDAYTQGRFTEHELHDKRWDGWLQCFDNRLPPAR